MSRAGIAPGTVKGQDEKGAGLLAREGPLQSVPLGNIVHLPSSSYQCEQQGNAWLKEKEINFSQDITEEFDAYLFAGGCEEYQKR